VRRAAAARARGRAPLLALPADGPRGRGGRRPVAGAGGDARVFPGRRGALYRAVVVGVRLHVLVVRRLLRAARRRAEARAGAPQVDAGRPVRTQVRDPRR
jgi:hypothetical protein